MRAWLRPEASAALAVAALAVVLAAVAPGFYAPDNLRDVLLANLPVLIVAVGATLVILAGEIDISSGSMFASCSIVAGLTARGTGSIAAAALAACLTGVALGAVNGALVAYARIPSIVVTLASMVALRDGLRWATQGAWIADLPRTFQWFGLTQAAYPAAAAAVATAVFAVAAWLLAYTAAGRAVYATGSHLDAARLAGIPTARVKCLVFALAGGLTGVAAVLNAARFSQIPSNTGLGLEMKVVAAAVVGGAAITGGRGTLAGTLLGVALLGIIGPALTFLGVTAYWERALQGAIIVAAVASEVWRRRAPAVARPHAGAGAP